MVGLRGGRIVGIADRIDNGELPGNKGGGGKPGEGVADGIKPLSPQSGIEALNDSKGDIDLSTSGGSVSGDNNSMTGTLNGGGIPVNVSARSGRVSLSLR